MIDLEGFSFTYDGRPAPALVDVDLHVPEGHLALVTGRTGSGKSTLLRAVNGLVPHFTGGHVEGRAMVDGRDTRTHPPRELAEHVGVVGQDPLSGFVTDTVEEELAYGMEQLAIEPAVMRRRVEDTLDLLGIADLRRRALRTLSGGEHAAGRDRGGAHRRPRGCWCSTSRPRRSTRARPRRRWRRCCAWCTTSASRCWPRSTGSSASWSTPTR